MSLALAGLGLSLPLRKRRAVAVGLVVFVALNVAYLVAGPLSVPGFVSRSICAVFVFTVATFMRSGGSRRSRRGLPSCGRRTFMLGSQRSLAGDKAAGPWILAVTPIGAYTRAAMAGLGLSALVRICPAAALRLVAMSRWWR